ncbi:MAG: TIGR00730 family Rossman fold protein [Christensenellaceae bacterium]
MNICIYGGANDSVDAKFKDSVYNLAKSIAKRGHSLVFGGGGYGMMGAAAKGFHSEGANICSIIPEFFKELDFEPRFEHSTETVYTKEMYERKRLLESRSDAFIVAPGGIGTFDEFFAVLTNKHLKQNEKPIVVFNVDGYYDELLAFLQKTIELKFVSKDINSYIMVSESVEEIIGYIESYKAE